MAKVQADISEIHAIHKADIDNDGAPDFIVAGKKEWGKQTQ